MKVAIIGIPLDLGTEKLGVDLAPDAFRDQKIVEKLTQVGFSITDLGDIECTPRKNLKIGNPNLKYLDEILSVSEQSAEKTFDLVKKEEKVIAIGGDHSVCLGVISGASEALDGEIGLIYIDAHGDLNTEETTLTGNIHGMPLALLLGFGDKSLTQIKGSRKKIDKNNLLHIGGSDFDLGEIDLIKNENLNTFTMVDLLSEGLKPLFSKIQELSKRIKNIWVSFDLDAIDEIYAPGVGMPNKAGLTYREVTIIADFIGKNCSVIGIDLVEYNPLTDINGKTAELGIELIAKVMGKNYNWYTNYIESNKLK